MQCHTRTRRKPTADAKDAEKRGAVEQCNERSSSVAYGYLANSPLVANITFQQSGTTRMTTVKQNDYLNRLTSVQSWAATFAATNAYAYNNANQRTAVTNSDSSRWSYGYDALGQVTSGKRYWSDGVIVAGQQYEYSFDDIGNRTQGKSGGDENGANLRTGNYTNNALNQLTGRGVPGYVDVMGAALATNAVTVNGLAAYRKGEYFRKELPAANASSAVWTNITVSSGGTNVSGYRFVAQTPEAFGYDADGNLTNDGRWVFTWDAENRLKQVESLASSPTASKRRVVWEYDARGRRIRQTTYDGSGGSYVAMEDLKFLSDGWRHIAELSAANNALVRRYVWGLDLSGSLDGAGGVGGLLIVNSTANGAHFCAYDGNGNVVGLVNASDGTESARYEYGPFGEPLRITGLMGLENPFRFSTKRTDNTTDFVLYEYRLYSPSSGRWLSRDPAGEKNGYGFVRNETISSHDLLGLWAADTHYTRTTMWAEDVGIDPAYAIMIGAADDAIDTLFTTMVFSDVNWAWHFNRSPAGKKDSRLILSDHKVLMAKLRCDCSRGTDDPYNASFYLGHALHPRQDWVAHADFNRKSEMPSLSGFHWWEKILYWHNYHAGGASTAKQVDDASVDADGPDGRATLSAMRDYWPLSNGDLAYITDFHPGRQRINLTESLTKSVLSDFQTHVRNHAVPGGECVKVFLNAR